MVMELLAGQDLSAMLDERHALPEAEAVDYVLQACAGIAEAHRMGIVHRDLKPSNLFVTRRSDGLPLLKVLDFGISKQLTDPTSGAAVPTFTNTRTLMGSPNYMSPEQVRDARRVDGRTDIWALGVILQELITDAPVFHGESFPGVCAAIVADPPMPVRTMRPDVSTELEAVIGRCLEKDPKARFQSIAELQSALSPLAPRLSRSGNVAQPGMYSSGTRVAIARPSEVSIARANDPTVMNPSDAPGGPDRTLESARLATGRPSPAHGSTQTALASTDPRVEVVSAPSPTQQPRRLPRWLLPLAAATALGAGAFWLMGKTTSTPGAASSEVAPPPAPAGPTAFTLSIDSEPPGAAVTEGSLRLGTTPFSLSMSLPENASPRVFVIEKEGYQPYVVRQGAARGEVRVMAALTQRVQEPPPPAAASAAQRPAALATVRPQRPAVKKPLPTSAPPPSDIRLER
jgi:serine/threonine-protein kinase